MPQPQPQPFFQDAARSAQLVAPDDYRIDVMAPLRIAPGA
jgi:hypothetical protein